MENKEINRMCCICKNRYNKNEMIRLVKQKSGEILVDLSGKMNGRGAYICKNPDCLERVKNQKILSRLFKCEIPSAVYVKLCEELFGK